MLNMAVKSSKVYRFFLSLCINQHNFDVINISLKDDTNFILPFWGLTQQHEAVIRFRCYECHGSSKMIIHGCPVSQLVWHAKEPNKTINTKQTNKKHFIYLHNQQKDTVRRPSLLWNSYALKMRELIYKGYFLFPRHAGNAIVK